MTLSLKDVGRLATEVAASEYPALTVVGVTTAEGASSYAEIILTISGCRAEPCRMSIGMARDTSEADFRASLSQKLRQHVADHQRD